jgi:hypothetical protein
MDTKQFTWNGLLYYIDVLIQKGELTENELVKIINMVDIKKLVKNNILSDDFINNYIVPRINENDYDDISINDIKKYQDNIKKN